MATFEAIASTTLSSNTADVTFSSIPGTYEHLQLRMFVRGNRSANWQWIYAQFNSDTGSNYAYSRLYGANSTASADKATAQTFAPLGFSTSNNSTANCFGVSVVDILDYASTDKYTTIRSICGQDQNNTNGTVYLFSDLWLSTSAITSIRLYPVTDNWVAGSVFALYGLRSS